MLLVSLISQHYDADERQTVTHTVERARSAAKHTTPAAAGARMHWPATQRSIEHALPSSQSLSRAHSHVKRPAHTPPAPHTSLVVQLFASSHAAPTAASASLGHCAPAPVQRSAASHCPAAARHTIELSLNASAGQPTALPEQNSASSHGPAAARHTVVGGRNVLLLHVPSSPEQKALSSYTPAAARHRTPAFTKLFGGHVALVLVHTSATSQAPTAARHTIDVGKNESARGT